MAKSESEPKTWEENAREYLRARCECPCCSGVEKCSETCTFSEDCLHEYEEVEVLRSVLTYDPTMKHHETPKGEGEAKMSKYRKKPVVIEAHQWFKNGDHPLDYEKDLYDPIAGKTYTAGFQAMNNWEGQVVRHYRHSHYDGEKSCPNCHNIMNEHGWIDTKEGGHNVCPGDWIITGVEGERYPCKPSIFDKTYEAVTK